MRQLECPDGFAFPALVRSLADQDSMYEGDDAHYLAVGASALGCITAALHGREPRRILDLPCGYGRVTRFLRARYPKAEITVCELDRAGVDFCAEQFDARPAYSTADLADLRLAGTFDLIWVGSLITHLSLGQTSALLRSLARVLSPAGRIVASVHGLGILERLNNWGYGLEKFEVAGLLRDFGETGYGHRGYGGGDGYGISLTDRLFWAQYCSAGPLAMAGYAPQAWDGHHDILVLRRRGVFGRLRARLAPKRVADAAEALLARRAASAHDPRLAAFDAAAYLARHPDVAAAVEAGTFNSAFQHYWQHGQFEGRATGKIEAAF